MDRGLYAASSGGLHRTREVQVISNNLANANTVGFKAERLVNRQQNFQDTLAGRLENMPNRAQVDHQHTPGVVHVSSETDFTQGPIHHTGNPLDVALQEGEVFFAIQTEQGERFTKAGNFSLDSNSQITTPDGGLVLGNGGPITVGEGDVRITPSGIVLSDGEEVGRIRTVRVTNVEDMRREEGVRFRLAGDARAEDAETSLVPGAVEMPNINVVESMVQLISAQRGFEAYQKTAQSINEVNETALRTGRSG